MELNPILAQKYPNWWSILQKEYQNGFNGRKIRSDMGDLLGSWKMNTEFWNALREGDPTVYGYWNSWDPVSYAESQTQNQMRKQYGLN